MKHLAKESIAYDPDRLFDVLCGKLRLENDVALSRLLEVAPPVINSIRRRRTPVGASLLIRMHQICGLSIRDLRILMGDRRSLYRMSNAQSRTAGGEVDAALS